MYVPVSLGNFDDGGFGGETFATRVTGTGSGTDTGTKTGTRYGGGGGKRAW
jgi:hypothetical protein